MDYDKDERNISKIPVLNKSKTNVCEGCKFDKHCWFQDQVPEGMAITRCGVFRLKEVK